MEDSESPKQSARPNSLAGQPALLVGTTIAACIGTVFLVNAAACQVPDNRSQCAVLCAISFIGAYLASIAYYGAFDARQR